MAFVFPSRHRGTWTETLNWQWTSAGSLQQVCCCCTVHVSHTTHDSACWLKAVAEGTHTHVRTCMHESVKRSCFIMFSDHHRQSILLQPSMLILTVVLYIITQMTAVMPRAHAVPKGTLKCVVDLTPAPSLSELVKSTLVCTSRWMGMTSWRMTEQRHWPWRLVMMPLS